MSDSLWCQNNYIVFSVTHGKKRRQLLDRLEKRKRDRGNGTERVSRVENQSGEDETGEK